MIVLVVIHALEIKVDVIMQILLILGMLIMMELSLKHVRFRVRVRVCHDQVSLSQVMDLYCFVYDFVIFSLIDDYDDVVGDLEWFQVKIYMEKKGESKNSED